MEFKTKYYYMKVTNQINFIIFLIFIPRWMNCGKINEKKKENRGYLLSIFTHTINQWKWGKKAKEKKEKRKETKQKKSVRHSFIMMVLLLFVIIVFWDL